MIYSKIPSKSYIYNKIKEVVMQYSFQDIAKFNIAKGLVANTSNPDKFVYFIQKTKFLLNIYDEHPTLKNEHENWLFYIVNNISNVKNWIKKTLPLMSNDEIHRINKEGNNIFIEAVKSNHLKTALLLIDKGVDFNHINNNGDTFIKYLSQHIKNERYKRNFFKYLIFLSKFIKNDFDRNISVHLAKEIKECLELTKMSLDFHFRKSDIVGYPEYWNNIINFNNSLISLSEHLEEVTFKKILEQDLSNNNKPSKISKI